MGKQGIELVETYFVFLATAATGVGCSVARSIEFKRRQGQTVKRTIGHTFHSKRLNFPYPKN